MTRMAAILALALVALPAAARDYPAALAALAQVESGGASGRRRHGRSVAPTPRLKVGLRSGRPYLEASCSLS